MKPVHGDTVSNDDSSSSAWCSYSNQSGVSFRRLSSLQGAKTDRILHEKYIPLKENNLLEKLVKTRVLYEELRHQILSSSLSTTSKPNLIPGKPTLGAGKHVLKANKSKIIELVDLVDKGVILRPEKLCECCDCNSYNSETRYKYGPKERRQRQIHPGGCLTSKSSIISKKITIGESRLEFRFKTKNIKSDPGTFQLSEFVTHKSREVLTRDHGKPHFNTHRTSNKKSHHKLKRSKPPCMDGAKLAVSKIKQQAVENVKNTKSISNKSLEPTVNLRHYLKTKPCGHSNITQNTLITDFLTKTDKKESSCLSTEDLTANVDVKINKNCYMGNWNYKIECPNEKSRDNSRNAKHRITGTVKESLPFTLDIKVKAEKNTIKKMEINLCESCKKETPDKREDNSEVLKLNENFNIIALSQIMNSKKCPLVLQGQKTHFSTKNNSTITSSKHSIPLLSVDSTPQVDSGLLLSDTKCKFEKACLCCRVLQREDSFGTKYENTYKTNTLKSSCFCTNCQKADPITNKNKYLDHGKYLNPYQTTSEKSSSPIFCRKLAKSTCFSLVENKLLIENRAINPDQLISDMTTDRYNNSNKSKICGKSIIDTSNLCQQYKEKHKFNRKITEDKLKRKGKNEKCGSHALKRCICTSKIEAININNERQISCITDTESTKFESYQIRRSNRPNLKEAFLQCDPLLYTSEAHNSTTFKSWKMQNQYIACNLTSKSLASLKECRFKINPLQVKLSDFKNCPYANTQNNIEFCWPLQYKKSKIGSPIDNTKSQLRKHYLHKLSSFKLGSKNIKHSISKPTTFSKATMMSLDRIFLGPQVVSEFEGVDKSSFFAKTLPHYLWNGVFHTHVNEIGISKGDEISKIPIQTWTSCRKAKSTSTFLSQSIFHTYKTKKVHSCFDTYKADVSVRTIKLKKNHENLQFDSQKAIKNDFNNVTVHNSIKETSLSAPDIIHKMPVYLNKSNGNMITLKEISRNTLRSRNYKLIKIQKEIYLMISPSSKYHFSTLKVEKSRDIINSNYTSKHLCKNINKGTRPQKPRSQSNSKSKTTHESKTNQEDDKCSKIYQCHSKRVKQLKNISPVTDISEVPYARKYPSNPQYFDRTSSIMSVSSTIKSKTSQSYFQSQFNLFQVTSSKQNETVKVKSQINCKIIKSISSKKVNVKTSSMEHFSVMEEEPCHIRPFESRVDIDFPSHIFKPNSHLTGVSSLLRSCFCTMNVQVDGKREIRNLPYKLKPYECAPYDCIPYECDPYECQKLIIKRLKREKSSKSSTEKKERLKREKSSSTEKKMKSSSSEASKARRLQSSSMRRPKHMTCRCDRQHHCICKPTDKCLCTEAFRSNVEFSKKKSHSKTSDKHLRSKGLTNRVHESIANETQSNMREMHHKTPSVSSRFRTLKLQKTEGNKRMSDYQTVSTSTPSTKITSRKINRLQSTELSNKYSGLLPYQCEPNICIPGKCDPIECLEVINARNKHGKDIHNAEFGAIKQSSISRLSSNMKKHKFRGQSVQSKYVINKPVGSRELRAKIRELKSKHSVSVNKPSTTSARQAVKISSNFNFSVQFYKDGNESPVSRFEKPISRNEISSSQVEKRPVKDLYKQEYRVIKTRSRKRSSRNVISQTEKLRKGSVPDSNNVFNTSSHAESLRRGQTAIRRSFLKRCFCTARLQSLKKKPLQKKVYKNVSSGTHEIAPLKMLGESVTIVRPVKTQTKSQEQAHKNSFTGGQCMCKTNSVDKGSGTERYPRGVSPKRCQCPSRCKCPKKCLCPLSIEKNVEPIKPTLPDTERHRIKSISTISSKTSKGRSTQFKHQPTPSIRQVKPTLSPDTLNQEEPMEASLHRQAVRIGSSFSFDIEFHKDQLFPSDEKVQAAAEAVQSTRDKMHDVNRPWSKRYKSLESSFYSLSSEINKVKAVGPMLRRCFCTLKLQDEKQSQQNSQTLHPYYSMSTSMHRGTGTPLSRPVANFHNRGVMTVYKLRTFHKLAPGECEPGVCIPGECDPYECLRRMNRRHAGSGTDSYSTRSNMSMTGPGRRHRDNRVQFSPRERRPRTREGYNRPRPMPRPPRNGGIEVRQQPKSKSNRQAVKIGSNFSFNIEFYKDRSKGGDGSIPCPKPCPKPCPELCPKTCPKRFVNSGTDAYSVTSRNQHAQRRHGGGNTRNRDSQVWGRKMRSTMTGVGPFLKRCFCTLQLQRRPQKELPHRERRHESDSSSVGTETGKYRQPVNYREQGTRPRRRHRYHGRTLDPNECEPGVCVPGQCDPYVCLERIKRRGMHSKYAGPGRHKVHSVSSSVTDPYRRHRNRSVSSSMMDPRRPHRAKHTQHNYRPRRVERERPMPRERSPPPPVYQPAPTSHRQAVRLGSSFSFNIEFYKDRTQPGVPPAPPPPRPVHIRRVERPSQPQRVRYIKRPVPVRRIRTDSIGSGPTPARTRSMSSSYRNNMRNRHMQANSRTLLKRCFCTLKLQKLGTHQRGIQESNSPVGTYYRTAGSQLRRREEIVPQYRHAGTRSRRKRHRLDPNECEPGVCVPGSCDPYECLERIKRRNLLTDSGTGMRYPQTRSMANITPHYNRNTSMNTAMYREPRKKHHARYTDAPRMRPPPQPRMRQPPPRPSRALENIHNRQAVRLGSSFSFNVEFYKDKSKAQAQAPAKIEAPCHPAICKDFDCTTIKCKTSSCSTSCPITNQRTRNVQSHGGGHHRSSGARSTRTESRGSGVPLLKRCFCTLTLQRAEVRTINPFNMSLRSQDQSTCTKYMDVPCNYSGDYEPFKRRGLRRISRTSGSYMARSRDVSGGQLGSRFMSNDTQYGETRWHGGNAQSSRWYGRNPQRSISKWYDRSSSERNREGTIVEEPRFQMFNRPNTKHTVKISSNCNFNIEFYKDIIFPDPCDCELEEDSDEMSAITKLQQTFYPRFRQKKSRKHFYEGDDMSFSTERYRPRFHRQKTITPRAYVEYGKSAKIVKEMDERSKKSKTFKEPDEHGKKSKTEKELDVLSKKSKTVKDVDEHSKKTKTVKDVDEHSKKSKIEKELDEHSKKSKSGKVQDEQMKKIKSGKEIDERSKKSKSGKEIDERSKKSKSGKEIEERSKKSKSGKEIDKRSKKSKSGKEIDERSKKSKSGKEIERSKKSKSGKEIDKGSKKSKSVKDQDGEKPKVDHELDERSKKLKSDKQQSEHVKKISMGKKTIVDDHIEVGEKNAKPMSKLFTRLRSSKGFKCICPPNQDNCLCLANQAKCLCPSNQTNCLCPLNQVNCLCSANGNIIKPSKGNKKYKCLCPPGEPSIKQGLGNKTKSKNPENVFINKAITIARVEMRKQNTRFSATRMLPRLRPSKLYMKTVNSVVTLASNETKKRTLPRKLQTEHERGDSIAFAADEVPIKESTSGKLYLCRHKLLKSMSEQNFIPYNVTTADRSITSLKNKKETSSTILPKVKLEEIRSNALTSVLRSSSSSASSESKSGLSQYHSYTTFSVSQSKIHIQKANQKCSADQMQTIHFYDHFSEADIVERVTSKLLGEEYKSFRLPMSPGLHSRKALTSVGAKKIKNSVSTSGMLLNFMCSSKFRRTKSVDGNCIAISNTYPKPLIKTKSSTCNKSACVHFQEICFCTKQMLKTEQCRSNRAPLTSDVNNSRLDQVKPLSIFTPKEYWVQYQIQYPKLSKRYPDKQTVTHKCSKRNQTESIEIETIMAYSPRKFHNSKSIMLFDDKSKITCNDICCLFCTSNSKLPAKQNISDMRTCSTCEYHNQFYFNHHDESVTNMLNVNNSSMIKRNDLSVEAIKIEPWDPLVYQFLRALSTTKKSKQPQSVVLKTSKHRIQFTTAESCSKKYKDSSNKCTYKTSFRKKIMVYRSYPRQFGNVDKIGNSINSRKTGIKFVEKSHACYRAQRKRTVLQNSSKATRSNSSQMNEMQFFYMPSGSDTISVKTLSKQDTNTLTHIAHNKSYNTVSSDFHGDTKHPNYKVNRDKFSLTTDSLERQKEMSSPSVKIDTGSSDLKCVLMCPKYNIVSLGRINLENTVLTTNAKDHMLNQKPSKDRQKYCPCFYCKKKGSSKRPKTKRKVKCKSTGDGDCVIEAQKDSETANNIQKESSREDEISQARASKQILEAGSVEKIEDMTAELQTSLEGLEKEDNLKSKRVLKNHPLFIVKILTCMNKLRSAKYKNLCTGKNVFEPKHSSRHLKKTFFKQFRINLGRTIKSPLQKPFFKYSHHLKQRNLNEEVLPKPSRVTQNPVDIGFNKLAVSFVRSKPYYCIYCLWPRFYPHFVTLVRVWRQLIHVLLLVLWSPCLFSAQCVKAFLCCFIRFRLHCYLK